MYCPKCGKDCADANFCPDCGQDMRSVAQTIPEESFEEKKQRLKASGQAYCPFCLSTSVALQEKKHSHFVGRFAGIFKLIEDCAVSHQEKKFGRLCICLKCGKRWYPKMFALSDRNSIYVAEFLSEYPYWSCAMEKGSSLYVYKDRIEMYHPKKKTYVAYYNQIIAIEYREPLGPLPGRLSIRDEENWKKWFPNSLKEAEKDNRTVFFHQSMTKDIRRLVDMLQKCVAENKRAGIC